MKPPNSRIARAAEKEYGKPFWCIVRDYANDGESVHATALILGWKSHGTLRAHVIKNGIGNWFVDARESNGWRAGQRDKPRPVIASGCLKAATRSNFNKHAFMYGGVLDTLNGHARRTGVAAGIAHSRKQRGMTMEQILFKGCHARKKKQSEDHPWKK